MKSYRRFIRVNNEIISSPRFRKKEDAEKWYHAQRRNKQLMRDGLVVADGKQITFIEYSREWMKKRMVGYPMATWKLDEQRLRTYILPFISEIEITKITAPMIKTLLQKISEPGFLKKEKPEFAISTSTRTRVKALLSTMFSDALNEDPPVVNFNPVAGIKFKGKRVGAKKPRHLESAELCLKFIKAAKELGSQHYIIACIFLMSGLRKQELIALRWKSFNPDNNTLLISEKYEQASNSLLDGTKGGENVVRTVPISKHLAQALKKFRKTSQYKDDDNFIVSRHDGRYYDARTMSRFIEDIREKAELDISSHGLRHTFGREFAQNTGNLKALQAILGHSSSSTTDIYSDLAGDRIKGFGESVSFDISVKRSRG